MFRGEDCLTLTREGRIPLFRDEVRTTRGSVSDVGFTGSPSEAEVEIGKEHRPASLATIEYLRRHEIFEVFVVCDDGDGMWGPEKPGTMFTKAFDDAEEFLVMNFIVDFGRGKLAGVEGDRMEIAILIGLLKNTGESEIGSVGGKGTGSGGIEVVENGEGGEATLEGFEGVASGLVENERSVFACEESERSCDGRIVVDEAAVEVGETEE